jgi:hypothetical protein
MELYLYSPIRLHGMVLKAERLLYLYLTFIIYITVLIAWVPEYSWKYTLIKVINVKANVILLSR